MVSSFPGMGGYSAFGGGYGAYGGMGMPFGGQYDMYGNGVGFQGVQTAPVKTPPLTQLEETRGELNRDSQEKKSGYIGALPGAAVGGLLGAGLGKLLTPKKLLGRGGAAVGAAAGTALCPGVGTIIGGAIGGLGGVLGGIFIGDKFGKLSATMTDVEKDGKLNGNNIGEGSYVF